MWQCVNTVYAITGNAKVETVELKDVNKAQFLKWYDTLAKLKSPNDLDACYDLDLDMMRQVYRPR